MYQIFVVEDELLIRQSIRNVIENMAGPYVFCGEASDGEMALSMMQDLMPDILLTDIRMPFLDGFELIRHVKTMMPWLKVIIISGYGDFEYAQKAIALGVDEYLLKPIRSADIGTAIEKMARLVDETRAKNALAGGYDRDEIQNALHQHFMQQLLYGGVETSALIEKARNLHLDVVQPCYQPVLFYFDAGDLDQKLLKNAVDNVMGRMNQSLYYFNESNRMTLLVCGSDAEAVNEQVYQFINIFRHELQDVCPVITAVVGNVVTRLSAICGAYKAAVNLLKKAGGISAGKVLDVNDTAQITAEIVGYSGPFGEEFQQKLQYAASAQEISAMVSEILDGPACAPFDSMLMRYYTLIDVLKMTVQMIAKATPGVTSKDIATRLSSRYDIFAASIKKESFRETLESLLQNVVSLKQENLSHLKYGHVISRAEKYVADNFCDPNISLISVARHVGLSAAHFSTVFSQSMGRSFINYLTAMRIEKAKELLAHTGMRLSAIAMEIGYNEPNYFSHVFRKVEGMTPKEYRSLYSPER